MQIKRAWNIIKDSRNYIYTITGIFIFGILLGFFMFDKMPIDILQYIEAIIKQLEGKSALQISLFIIINNVKVTIYALVLGIFAGIFPIIFTLINGFIIGAVSRTAVIQENAFVLWKLIPHGIFEIPAIILAFSFGLKLGMQWFKPPQMETITNTVKEIIVIFLYIILPLLIIAGLIEGFLI